MIAAKPPRLPQTSGRHDRSVICCPGNGLQPHAKACAVSSSRLEFGLHLRPVVLPLASAARQRAGGALCGGHAASASDVLRIGGLSRDFAQSSRSPQRYMTRAP